VVEGWLERVLGARSSFCAMARASYASRAKAVRSASRKSARVRRELPAGLKLLAGDE